MEDFAEWLTRDNVAAVKVVLASVVAALAFYQAALMAVGYGKLPLPFLKPRPASRAHRAIGDAILFVTILIAFLCLASFDGGDGGVHAVIGSLLIGVFALKVATVRGWLPWGRYLPLLGIALLLLFAGAWASSSAEHVL